MQVTISITFSHVFAILIVGAFVGGSIVHAYHIKFFDGFHFRFWKKWNEVGDTEIVKSRFKASVACFIGLMLFAYAWSAFAS